MIDPVSAIGMATAAYRGIKSAIDTGKELSDMAGTLNQWATSISDLDFAHRQAENPPMFKKIFGSSQVEQNALEVWGHKQKAKEMREELQSYISLFYGPSAWKEIVAIEAKMRKERKEAIYAAEERKQAILEFVVGTLAALTGAAILGMAIYVIGIYNGNW
jgi:FMN phosphatase YigB (HAD superfamily)